MFLPISLACVNSSHQGLLPVFPVSNILLHGHFFAQDLQPSPKELCHELIPNFSLEPALYRFYQSIRHAVGFGDKEA